MKDELKGRIMDLLREHTAERIYESWFNQQRDERKRRLHFVTLLCAELTKIKETMTFATGLAELGIESVIEGDWKMVKEWAEHFTFADENEQIRQTSASVYARFSELLQQCWETRPGTSAAQA